MHVCTSDITFENLQVGGSYWHVWYIERIRV